MNGPHLENERVADRSTRAALNQDFPTPSGKRSWIRGLFYTVCTIATVSSVGFVAWNFYTGQNVAAELSPKSVRLASNQTAKNGNSVSSTGISNIFSKHAADAGVNRCSNIYTALGEMLTAGSQYMIQTETNTANANTHAVQGIVGMEYQAEGDYTGPAAGLVFAAPIGEGCEGTMVRVVPFAQSCESAVAMLPKGSHPSQTLSNLPVYRFPDGGFAMMLPSTSNNCVVLSILRGAV